MKQYDKNSLIGFVLMAIILIVFNTFFFPEAPNVANEDVIVKPNAETTIKPTTIPLSISDTNINEELKMNYGSFANATIGKETLHTIENDKLRITVSNKGGRITSVILKEYETYDSFPLDLFDADSSRFNLQFTTGNAINTADLFFIPDQSVNSLSMKSKADEGHYIEFIYTLTDDYLIDFDINLFQKETCICINLKIYIQRFFI